MGWGMMGNWGNMMYGWGYGGNSGIWGMGIIGMGIQLLVVIGVILLVMYLFRRIFPQSQIWLIGKQNSGLEILRERYARGEIDSTEYQIIKRDLENK